MSDKKNNVGGGRNESETLFFSPNGEDVSNSNSSTSSTLAPQQLNLTLPPSSSLSPPTSYIRPDSSSSRGSSNADSDFFKTEESQEAGSRPLYSSPVFNGSTPKNSGHGYQQRSSNRQKSGSRSNRRKNIHLLDVYQSSANYVNAVKAGQRDTYRRGKLIQYLWKFIRNFVFLATLGGLTSVSASGFDGLVTTIVNWRNSLIFPLFLLFVMVVTVIAPAITCLIAPTAEGSGIPAMKSALSGFLIHRFLSIPTLLVKYIGLLCSYLSGLSIGKEGPFVHVACVYASLLMRIPIFESLRVRARKRLEMLAAACAVGVAATFGTPFGGVIFSIEVTASHFMVKNLPRSLFATIAGSFLVRYILTDYAGVSLFSTNFEVTKFETWFLIVFLFFGIVGGIMGGFFNKFVTWVIKYRKDFVMKGWTNMRNGFDDNYDAGGSKSNAYKLWGSPYDDVDQLSNGTPQKGVGNGKPRGNRKDTLRLRTLRSVGLVLTLTFVNAFVAYFCAPISANLTKMATKDEIKWLFRNSNESIPPINMSSFSNSSTPKSILQSEDAYLFWYVPYKFILTVASISLPIPTGLFSPVFAFGAATGRLAGVIMQYLGVTNYSPGEMAVVAAAAMASGVTRTVSTSVIVLELTGQPHLQIPVTVAVLAAIFVGDKISKSIYDCLLLSQHLPFPKDIASFTNHNLKARDLMTPLEIDTHDEKSRQYGFVGVPGFQCLTLWTTFLEADGYLKYYHDDPAVDCPGAFDQMEFPLLKSPTDTTLVGVVAKRNLTKATAFHLKTLAQRKKQSQQMNSSNKSSSRKDDDITGHLLAETLRTEQEARNLDPINFFREEDSTIIEFNEEEYGSEYNSNGNSNFGSSGESLSSESSLSSPSLNNTTPRRVKRARAILHDEVVNVNTSPFVVASDIPLHKLDTLFKMLVLSVVYVTEHGKLVGRIRRDEMISKLDRYKRFS